MLQNALTFQLAQMALENQYDRSALCWDVVSLSRYDANWREELQLVEQASALVLLEQVLNEIAAADSLPPEYEIEEVRATYTFHLLIARLVFRNNPSRYEALRLLGKREECLEKWLRQANEFYTDLGRLSPAMDRYGISLTELRQAKAMVEAVMDRYL